MAHQYSRVGFNSAVEVNEVNLNLSYGGVTSFMLFFIFFFFFSIFSFSSSRLDSGLQIICQKLKQPILSN